MKMSDCPVSVVHKAKLPKFHCSGWKHEYTMPVGYGGIEKGSQSQNTFLYFKKGNK